MYILIQIIQAYYTNSVDPSPAQQASKILRKNLVQIQIIEIL